MNTHTSEKSQQAAVHFLQATVRFCARPALWLALTISVMVPFSCAAQKIDYDKKIKDLGIVLSEPSKPVANYVKAVRVGNLLFLSGHGPTNPDGSMTKGRVGVDLTIEEGYAAAKLTAEGMLATLKMELGDLNRVKRIVKVNGWVNCPAEFGDQPKVINGCSDLLVAVFGERGKHARAAMGAGSLPFNTSVEIEMIVEVE